MDLLRAPRNLAIVPALALLLAGCGGGGSNPLSTETVRVSADPEAVAYGGAVTVDWSAASSASFVSSNFGPDAGTYRGGSITDTPGTTTTYELRVYSERGNEVPGRATVTVAPAARNVLVAGDASQAGPEQIADFLRGLTTGTVAVAATVPAPTTAHGVLVVSPTIQNGTAARAAVKAWLDAGKAVVLLGPSPRLLATGDADNRDVSAIGAWFFGASELNEPLFIGGGAEVRPAPGGLVRLSAAIRGDLTTHIGYSIPNLGPQVDQVISEGGEGGMCAYAVPTGGRLVWSTSSVGYGSAEATSFRQAFESAFRWAAQ